MSSTAPSGAGRLRIVVGKPGLDGHDRGAKIVARALRDAGHEVIYTGLHQTPEQIVETAIQEDADLIGLSVLSGAHMTLFRTLIELLAERDASDIRVFGGGIIPEEDIPVLEELGVAKVFTPGAPRPRSPAGSPSTSPSASPRRLTSRRSAPAGRSGTPRGRRRSEVIRRGSSGARLRGSPAYAELDLVEQPGVVELTHQVTAADDPQVLAVHGRDHLVVHRRDVALDEVDVDARDAGSSRWVNTQTGRSS